MHRQPREPPARGPQPSRSDNGLQSRFSRDGSPGAAASVATRQDPETPGAFSTRASQYFSPSHARGDRSSTLSAGASTPTSTSTNTRASPGRRRTSVRIRRVPSSESANIEMYGDIPVIFSGERGGRQPQSTGRPRSRSEPERSLYGDRGQAHAGPSYRRESEAMPRLTEEGPRPSLSELAIPHPTLQIPGAASGQDGQDADSSDDNQRPTGRGRRMLTRATGMLGHRRRRSAVSADDGGYNGPVHGEEYDDALVDLLDVVDPEVSTLSTLTNIQNSLFVPDLGSWVNRRPTYVLSDDRPRRRLDDAASIAPSRREEATDDKVSEKIPPSLQTPSEAPTAPGLERTPSITSRFSESRFAVLPHGVQLEGWSAEEKEELNNQVRHMLHSRRSRIKRSFKGFGKYVRRPLGFLVTLYATLITLFGLAWVLFLIGWIYVGDEQVYAIHVIDSVLVALFAIMGDGLAPFRAVDTYHMAFIAHYSRKTWNLREKMGLPELKNKNDLPTDRLAIGPPQLSGTTVPLGGLKDLRPPEPAQPPSKPSLESAGTSSPNLAQTEARDMLTEHSSAAAQGYARNEDDLEAAKVASLHVSVLSSKEQYRLEHHQKKFSRSHTFYQPHETETHYAFPIRYLIAIVLLLDAHSCLQISLGICTWGIDYRTRPFAITTVILCLSITCNVTAGILISLGDRKTRKKDVSRLLKRQELTGSAIKYLEERWQKEEKTEIPDDVEAAMKMKMKQQERAGLAAGGLSPVKDEPENERRAEMGLSRGSTPGKLGPRVVRGSDGRNRLRKGNAWTKRRKERKRLEEEVAL